ncbi:diguanylate cyclase [Desulfofundulus sp.]|uniref:sensor domain-containing diguanylate cyclase n=1 Tax=Desulfofundulus sp. TaxID=2282750 RepID=UPI003C74AAA4
MLDWKHEELFSFLEMVPLPIYIFQDNSFKYVNQRMVELAGYTREELLQINVWELIDPADRHLLLQRALRRLRGQREPGNYEFKAINRRNEIRYLHGYFSLISFDSRPAILGQLLDVTREKRLLNELQKTEARLRDIFDNVNDVIYLHDLKGRFLALNQAVIRATNFLPEELEGKEISTFLHPDVKHLVDEYLRQVIEKGEIRGLMRGLTKDGEEIFWEYQSVLFKGRQPYIRGIARDVTEQVKMRRELKEYLCRLEEQNKKLSKLNEELARAKEALETMVRTDPLTGLGNRLAFQEALEREVNRTKRYLTPFSLLIIDVTNFKKINDTLGHPAGDKALVRIAKLLRASCRQCDLLFRIGGDEFAVLLPCTGGEKARMVADRLRQKITGETIMETEVAIPVYLSIGVATLDSRQESLGIEGLIKLADARMYEEKSRQKAEIS